MPRTTAAAVTDSNERRRTQASRTAAAREGIVRATLSVLRDAGIEGFTTAAVAERAGVSKGLVHYHFETKEHLLLAAQSAFFHDIFDSITAMADSRKPSVERALWALDQLWAQVVSARRTIPVVLQLAAQASTDAGLRERFLDFGDQQKRLLGEGIRVVLGPLEPHLRIPLETLTRLLLGALIGLAAQLQFDDDTAAVEAAYRAFRSMIVSVLPAQLHLEEENPT